MPTDNPLADRATRQAVRQNIDDIAHERSHVVRDVCQDVLDALRLLDEQDRRIAELEAERTCAVHASLCDLICVECFETEQVTRLERERQQAEARAIALEAERDALRQRVREAFEEGANAVGGPPFFSQHLQDQWWEASATKRTMEKESK